MPLWVGSLQREGERKREAVLSVSEVCLGLSPHTEAGVPYYVVVVATNEKGSGMEERLLFYTAELSTLVMCSSSCLCIFHGVCECSVVNVLGGSHDAASGIITASADLHMEARFYPGWLSATNTQSLIFDHYNVILLSVYVHTCICT